MYDVRKGVYRGYRRQIEEMIHPARARLYALLPYEVRRLEAEAEYLPDARRLNVRAQLVTAEGSVPGRHVIRKVLPVAQASAWGGPVAPIPFK